MKHASDTIISDTYLKIIAYQSLSRIIVTYQQLSTTTAVSLHFNQSGHSINDVRLIPIELIRSKRDSVRIAREAHLINNAKTLHPFGIKRRDEVRQ